MPERTLLDPSMAPSTRPGRADGALASWRARVARHGTIVVLSLVAAILTCWLMPIACKRLIDGDEGYLLMAARLVSEGLLPYRDFFLPQGPVVPALFAALFWGIQRSWLAARLMAGAIAVGMGLLVYRETFAATRRHRAASFATALFALSGSSIGWLTIVKGYGLSALWLLAALYLAGKATRLAHLPLRERRGQLCAVAAGVATGLAASSRLYAIVAMPVLAIYMAHRIGLGRPGLRRLAFYAGGCSLGLVPLALAFFLDHRAFLFDTLLFHGVREYGQDSLLGTAHEKLPAALKAIGLHAKASYAERQMMGLLIVAVVAALARLFARARAWYACPSAATLLWPALLAASLLPNPFLSQYLCLLVPFLAIEAGCLLRILLERVPRRWPRAWPAAVAASAVVYLAYNAVVGWTERDRYLHTGRNVPGIWSEDRASRWQLGTMEETAAEIDSMNISVAASWWPGYFVSTHTRIHLELVNDFGFRAAEALSVEERRRFHVASQAEVGGMIQRRKPRLFVEGNWAAQPWAGWLPTSGYKMRKTVENVRLWTVD